MGAGADRRSHSLSRLICHIDTDSADRHDGRHSHSTLCYHTDNIQNQAVHKIRISSILVLLSTKELKHHMKYIHQRKVQGAMPEAVAV